MITALMICMVVRAADDDVEVTVKIKYNGAGTEVSMTVPDEISQYVNCTSGTSPHIKIVQSLKKKENPNNYVIVYSLSGTTTDGSFTLDAEIKTAIELNNLNMTNPSGPALNIQNGKNTKIYVKKNTENSLADGKNEDYNGCIHCEGHLEFKKTGTLNIVGNSKHAIYSKEYVQIAKPTINITKAKKDGIHCKQYFWIQDACTVNISGVKDDGIQVEVKGDTPSEVYPEHESDDTDEDTGNFYQDDGTLTISDCGGAPIKVDGKAVYNGGTQNFDKTAVSENNFTPTGITTLQRNDVTSGEAVIYDLNGRRIDMLDGRKGVFIIRKDNEIRKVIVK